MTRCLLLLCILCSLTGARAARAQALAPAEVLGQDRLITLDEAVALALETNLGLQVERLDPVDARERVRENEGIWDPKLFGTYDRRHTETPTASSVQRFFGTTTDRTTDDVFDYAGGSAACFPGASSTARATAWTSCLRMRASTRSIRST
jgi:hypothetical protein